MVRALLILALVFQAVVPVVAFCPGGDEMACAMPASSACCTPDGAPDRAPGPGPCTWCPVPISMPDAARPVPPVAVEACLSPATSSPAVHAVTDPGLRPPALPSPTGPPVRVLYCVWIL